MDSKLQSEVTFFVLFIVGLFTSLHCVGMCGGIMLSQCVTSVSSSNFQAIKPALLYNLGRVISYTILGGVIGAIGSVFSISLQIKSAITIFVGAFIKNNIQSAAIKGIGYELDPLVLVAAKNIETYLSFDFKSYDYTNENIDIVDITSKKVLKTIETNNEMSNITLKFENIGGYALFQGKYLIGVIEVVDNMDSVDLEQIRKEYIGN